MRSRLWILLAAALLAVPAAAQQPPKPEEKESVAEAARRAREKKKDQPRAERVITDDDIRDRRGTVNVVGGERAEEPAAVADGKKAPEDTEEFWRKKFAEARDKLRTAEREFDVLQRELNQMRLQYYDDPSEALRQQFSREDINKHTQKIEEKQKEVAALRAALDELANELRRRGHPPGWGREP